MQPFDSARLHFRPLTADDTAGMFELDSDPAVHRYLGGIGGQMVSEPAQSTAIIEFIQKQYAETGVGRWAVVLRETGEFMGWAGLKLVAGPLNGEHNFYDLGYRFIPRFWSQGYGFEAARAWLDYAFETLRLPRICAYVDWHNMASRRILAKIGMRQCPTLLVEGVPCIWYDAEARARAQPANSE